MLLDEKGKVEKDKPAGEESETYLVFCSNSFSGTIPFSSLSNIRQQSVSGQFIVRRILGLSPVSATER